jgi:mannose-1-phosphate guanylyltransferase
MKNTAACNLYMANKIAEINPNATMIVFRQII